MINKSDSWTIEVLKQRIPGERPGELQRIGREEELAETWSSKHLGSFCVGVFRWREAKEDLGYCSKTSDRNRLNTLIQYDIDIQVI